ncbi:MAG TPA: transposase [Asanoa sp.]
MVAGAYPATVRAQAAIRTLRSTSASLGGVLGAQVLAEFGDDTTRYVAAKARKTYAAIGPITRQSGKKVRVLARYAHNIRLIDALNRQAFAALRQPGNRPVGILHGCLKTGRTCDETTASAHQQQDLHIAG